MIDPVLVTVDADGDPDGIVWNMITARIAVEVVDLRNRIAILEAA
jgi:hypothetical protein